MAAQTWKLRRFGRLVAGPGGKEPTSWKIIEAKDNEPDIILMIMESGHLLVSQGQQCLETVVLLAASDSLKVHQKSDNLIFRLTVKGESHVMRVQFSGAKREEAVRECSSAVSRLMEYVPVTTQDNVAPPLTEAGPSDTQHLLGERVSALPLQHPDRSQLPQEDLEPLLRLCLLDPGFPALVERVEGELKKMLEE